MYSQCKEEINIVKETCDRILRSNKKVKMKYKFSSLTKLLNSPYYRALKIWNTLPDYIQNCKGKLTLKNKCESGQNHIHERNIILKWKIYLHNLSTCLCVCVDIFEIYYIDVVF